MYSSTIFKSMMFLSVFILFCNADCANKDKEPTCYLSEEFKSYVIFGEKSQWIYQNQIGELDTIKIISTEHLIQDGPHSYPTERFNIETSSNLNGNKKDLALCQTGNGALNCQEYNSYSSIYTSPTYFFCCCEEGTTIDNLTFIKKDTIKLGGELIENVRIFVSDSISPKSYKTLYYAKDIGLVKFDDYQNNQWILISYDLTIY